MNYKKIGKKIADKRILLGITQEELARVLNTSQSTVSAYESGKTLILTSFAIQICKTYNISLDWLMGRTN